MTDEESGKEPNDGSNGTIMVSIPSDPPGRLLLIAGAALVLGVAGALAYEGQVLFDRGSNSGWGIASVTFYVISSAVYGPALLLGLVAFLLVRSDERRDQAIKMTRLIMVAAVIVVLSGLAEAVCTVGSFLSNESSWVSGWWVASQTLSFLANAVFECGVLLGLVYVFRQQERKYAGPQLSGAAGSAAESMDSNGV